jgi:hypothetical protein
VWQWEQRRDARIRYASVHRSQDLEAVTRHRTNTCTEMPTFHCRRLNPGECFPTSKRAVRETFKDLALDFVTFGAFYRSHHWDRRLSHRPRIAGRIVAHATVSPDGRAHLGFYPMTSASYSTAAKEEFGRRILGQMSSWVLDRLAKPETSPDGYEDLLVEWTGREHRLHAIRYQTGAERPRRARYVDTC